jgi:hypothetical protein
MRIPCVHLALPILMASSLAAQTPADELTFALRAPESLPAESKATQSLQHGLALIRSGIQQDNRDTLFEALRVLNDTRVRHPAWPWPRFGLALAKLALAERDVISRPALGGQLTGESYRQGFWRSLEETFDRDSLFKPGLRFAMMQAARERDRSQPEVIARAVERAAHRWPDDSLAHLALAYVYRTALRYGDAAREFARYAELGGDPGIALLEQARSLAGDSLVRQAAQRYRDGVRHLSDSARARYRNDLAWVATRRELGEFDAESAEALPEWLTQFWQKRDALALRAPGDRLEEHLRRWAFVYRNFRVDAPDRWSGYVRVWSSAPGPCTRVTPDSLNNVVATDDRSRLADGRDDEAVLDHRAIIYMRHGAPAWGMPAETLAEDTGVRVAMGTRSALDSSLTAFPNATADRTRRSALWVYWIQGRARAYFFVPGMSASPAAPAGMASSLGPLTLSPTIPLILTPSLAQIDPVYAHAAHMYLDYNNGVSHATSPTCSPLVQPMLIQSEQDVETAVRTDSYSLLFRNQLDALMQVYAVGNAVEGTARLLVTMAIPVQTLDSLLAPAGSPWPLHLRVTAVDTLRDRVARLDTSRVLVSHASPSSGAFIGLLTELPVSAGHFYTHAAMFGGDQSTGSGSEWGNVIVSPSAFSISDVVLAVERGGVVWENHGDPVRINVTGAYRRGELAPIYYELYGRVPGRKYHTRISLLRSGNRNAEQVAVEFSRVADRADAHVQLTLDLSRLGPGRHLVTITVRDEETGAEVKTDRVVEIRK